MLRLTPTKEEAAKSEEIIALLADMSVSSAKFTLDLAKGKIGTCVDSLHENTKISEIISLLDQDRKTL